LLAASSLTMLATRISTPLALAGTRPMSRGAYSAVVMT
jgi:hypothetical protein